MDRPWIIPAACVIAWALAHVAFRVRQKNTNITALAKKMVRHPDFDGTGLFI